MFKQIIIVITCRCDSEFEDCNECTLDSWSRGCCSNVEIDCSDDNTFTVDSCPIESGCVHNDINCHDGDACTTDSCSRLSGCCNLPISCDDNNACTTDSCLNSTGCSNLEYNKNITTNPLLLLPNNNRNSSNFLDDINSALDIKEINFGI
ncbi:hypothetical protein ACTFIZ_009505 [Dictyostelium cf. discoideum]